MKIEIKVSQIQGAQWGPDLPASAFPNMPRNLLALATTAARRAWPEAEVTGVLTNEYVNSRVYGTPPEILEQLDFYVYDYFTYGALADSDFIAEAWLEEHPFVPAEP